MLPLTVREVLPPGHVNSTNACCFLELSAPPRKALLPPRPLPARVTSAYPRYWLRGSETSAWPWPHVILRFVVLRNETTR
jgi:hypothetical protein